MGPSGSQADVGSCPRPTVEIARRARQRPPRSNWGARRISKKLEELVGVKRLRSEPSRVPMTAMTSRTVATCSLRRDSADWPRDQHSNQKMPATTRAPHYPIRTTRHPSTYPHPGVAQTSLRWHGQRGDDPH